MIDKNLVRIGDTVVTWDNGFGYVTELKDDEFRWMILKAREIENACAEGDIVTGDYNSSVYKRIGCQLNKNPEEHLNYIEPLSENVRLLSEIRTKLNEVIKYINNKERTDETNC